MDILVESTYLKVDIVYSCLIETEYGKPEVKSTWWKEGKPAIPTKHTLKMRYSCPDKAGTWSYTAEYGDYTHVKKAFDEIMRQIKDQDSQYADRLLEDAIINGGVK